MPRKSSRDAYYFPFGAKDWRASESVKLMSMAEQGCFINLLAVSWLSSDEPCSIPSDDASIAKLLGIPVDEWRQYAPRVLAEFDENVGTRLRNEKLWKEYRAMQSKHRKQSQGGRATALKRWGERVAKLPLSNSLATASQSHSQSHSQKRKPSRAKPPRESWLVAVSEVYERHKGAGSFPWGEAGKHLKPVHDGGAGGEVIADHLDRCFKRIERGDIPKFYSLAWFAKNFADFKPLKFTGPVVVDGWMSAEVELATRPKGMVA